MRWILRLLSWVGRKARNKLLAIEEREAVANSLKKGTRVTLTKCLCPYDHSGIWIIDRYIHDAGDYRIIREVDGKVDFARRDVMCLV